MLDADALAEWVYRETGCAAQVPPGPAWLLEVMVGRDHVRFVYGAAVSVRAADRALWVTMPKGLHAEYRQIAFGTAVAEVAARRTGQVGWTRQEILDAAAAVIMPRDALATYVGTLGYDARELGIAFHVPEAFASRRMRVSGWLERSGEFSERSYRNVI